MRALLGNENLRNATAIELVGVANDSLVAHGQLMAAFGSAASQHGAAVFGLHA